MIVYIGIGNSDDKLTQAEWAQFYRDVNAVLGMHQVYKIGQWVSEPASSWQNACWCVEIDSDEDAVNLHTDLAYLAHKYRQDSISWAPALTAIHIQPAERPHG